MKKLLLPVLSVLCWSALCDAAYDVEAIRADAKFFTEASCSQLKAGVSAQDLAGLQSDLLKTVAAALLEGTGSFISIFQRSGKRLRKGATEVTEEHREERNGEGEKVRRRGLLRFVPSGLPDFLPSCLLSSVTSVSSVATTAV